MTTTKFSPGDRVRTYAGPTPFDGVVDGIWPDGTIRVRLDISGGNSTFHPKQLRRLVKRKRVVWESERPVCDDGWLNVGELPLFVMNALSKFIGKRVRIVITEAKEKK